MENDNLLIVIIILLIYLIFKEDINLFSKNNFDNPYKISQEIEKLNFNISNLQQKKEYFNQMLDNFS